MQPLTFNRRHLLLLWGSLWALFIILLCQPVSYGIMRLGSVIIGCVIWGSSLYLFWEKKLIRAICIIGALLVTLLIILPGSPADPDTLAAAYVRELIRYEGTPYVWGGENKLGIDCSGLVRQGLIQANWKLGVKSGNPALVRKGFEMWWYDAGADALRDEYRNYTTKMLRYDSINQLDSSILKPGDMAVTVDGEHILAYLGDLTWISADPDVQKTIEVTTPEPDNFWFNTPVYLLRWRQLSP